LQSHWKSQICLWLPELIRGVSPVWIQIQIKIMMAADFMQKSLNPVNDRLIVSFIRVFYNEA